MQKLGPIAFVISKHPIRLYFKLKLGRMNICNYPKWYRDDYKKYKSLLGDSNAFQIKDYPIFTDRNATAGSVRNYYFFQDLYMAQRIYCNKPEKHVDIGSRIDGFVAHVASFMEIELFDIRPLDTIINNVKFKQADLMDGTSLPLDYCDSISSLNALEHFGLGRYGDKIDPEGHIKAFDNITKILKKGGLFYFSVPMGHQCVEFNAHRCFGVSYLIDWVSKAYDIVSFAYIDDACKLHVDINIKKGIEDSFGCVFGCALFVLRKKE